MKCFIGTHLKWVIIRKKKKKKGDSLFLIKSVSGNTGNQAVSLRSFALFRSSLSVGRTSLRSRSSLHTLSTLRSAPSCVFFDLVVPPRSSASIKVDKIHPVAIFQRLLYFHSVRPKGTASPDLVHFTGYFAHCFFSTLLFRLVPRLLSRLKKKQFRYARVTSRVRRSSSPLPCPCLIPFAATPLAPFKKTAIFVVPPQLLFFFSTLSSFRLPSTYRNIAIGLWLRRASSPLHLLQCCGFFLYAYYLTD